MAYSITTRKTSAKDVETKLMLALKELQSSKELCNQLLQEREDSEEEIKIIINKNKGLKTELAELHVKFLDIVVQRDHLHEICEYLQSHDNCNGIVGIIDYFECNIMDLIKNINLVELRNAMSIIMEGYGMRIKGIHFLTTSRAADTFIAIFKQAVSAKVAQRIHVHKNIETLYEHLQRDHLPKDYGGKEKSIKILSRNLMDSLSSDEYKEYFNVMKQARTNEAYRCQDKFNDQYMGIAGSFRKLSVD